MIKLVADTVDELNDLLKAANSFSNKNLNDPPFYWNADHEKVYGQYVLYFGKMGASGQYEIDQDAKRMINLGLMDFKVDQVVTYVEQDEFHSSANSAANDAERYCINVFGLEKLMNQRGGGGGRPPFNTSVGGVFLLVGIKFDHK